MMFSEKNLAEFQRRGETELRVALEAGHFDGDPAYKIEVSEWLLFLQGIRENSIAEMQFASMKATQASADHAKRSADAAEKAATATGDSVRWAMWAAIASGLSAFVSLAAVIISVLRD